MMTPVDRVTKDIAVLNEKKKVRWREGSEECPETAVCCQDQGEGNEAYTRKLEQRITHMEEHEDYH